MIITTRFIGYCAATCAAVVLSARVACAQTVGTSNENPRAVALEQKANSWLGAPDKWTHVASAMERAAEIRGRDDAHAVADLMLAAAARYSAKDALAARAGFMRAAEWALEMGDVETAATGYARAAVLSAQLDDVGNANMLREKAERLTLSTLLTTAQRSAIRSQFTGTVGAR